jgi:bifunctional ADP-heptose synthase (sugar kinase/adenylyltransferase)
MASKGKIELFPELELEIGSKLQTFFDDIPLNRDVLIVCSGDTSPINSYLHARLKTRQEDNVQWNIISAKYARFSFLEQQRSLSEFLPLDTQESVLRLISKFGRDRILDSLELIKNAPIRIIGEIILDEYIYCDALGKVSKDPLVAFAKRESSLQLGGVLATAKHFAGMGCLVEVISETELKNKGLINNELGSKPNISLKLLFDRLDIRKTRYVDRASNNRVFETYEMPLEYSNTNFALHLKSQLPGDSNDYKLVLMDYGHGLMDSQLIDWLRIQPTQLIVNMQSNAANRGFNTVSRYKGVHSVFLNGGEVLLEARSKETDLGTLIPELGIALGIEEFYVTNGSRGIFAWTRNGGLYESPALAPLVIDRVGAGDATLAAVSAMRAVNIPIDICLFFGNIAGAILVGSIGNEISISADRLKKEADLILSKAESGI